MCASSSCLGAAGCLDLSPPSEALLGAHEQELAAKCCCRRMVQLPGSQTSPALPQNPRQPLLARCGDAVSPLPGMKAFP